ncbi:MAG: hypothetical protein HY000_39755 [Planctomycetes bacterium]|nr:hypothetical protein [Planctomycetota bacterium]
MSRLTIDQPRQLLRRPVTSHEDLEEGLTLALATGETDCTGQGRDLRWDEPLSTTFQDLHAAYGTNNDVIRAVLRSLCADHWTVGHRAEGTLLLGPLPINPVLSRRDFFGPIGRGIRPQQTLKLESIDPNKLQDPSNASVRKEQLGPVSRASLSDLIRGVDGYACWEGDKSWLERLNTSEVACLRRAIYVFLNRGIRRDDDAPYQLLVGYHTCLLDTATIAGQGGKDTEGLIADLDSLGPTGGLRDLLADSYHLEVKEDRSHVLVAYPKPSPEQLTWLKDSVRRLRDLATRDGRTYNEPLHVGPETRIWTQTGAYAFKDKRNGQKTFGILEVTLETYFAFVMIEPTPRDSTSETEQQRAGVSPVVDPVVDQPVGDQMRLDEAHPGGKPKPERRRRTSQRRSREDTRHVRKRR